MDLVSGVTASEPSVHPYSGVGGRGAPDAGLRVVAYDFGVKTTMVQLLTTLGTVTVVPAGTTADDVLALEPDGVFLSNGPGDPAALPGPAAAVADLVGRVPDLRHLPRPPDPCHRARRHHLQAAVRPPRRQPPGAAPRDRRRRDHEPEPQLRRRRRLDPRRRDDAREPERRRGRGVPLAEGARVLGAVPPRGRARPARRALPVRRLPRPHAGRSHRSRPRRQGALGGAGERQHRATPRRPAHDPRHRVRPDRDRPGLRVRLLGHPGLPGLARGGLPRGPRQLQPGHDHDRPRHGRPHLRRAARRRRADARSSRRSGRTRCCRRSAGRPRSTSPWSSSNAGCSSATGWRSSAPGPRRSRRPRTATASRRRWRRSASRCRVRASPTRSRRRRRSPRRSATRSWCGRASSSAARAPASPRTPRTSGTSPPRASRPARSARSSSSGRSPAGRSSSSR